MLKRVPPASGEFGSAVNPLPVVIELPVGVVRP